jgi:hypothetical protein
MWRPPLTQEQRQMHHAEITSQKFITECFNCWSKGHWAKECPYPSRLRDTQFATIAKGTTQTSDKPAWTWIMISSPHAHQVYDWFIDSAVTHHMTGWRELFHNFQEIPKRSWPVEAVLTNGWVTYILLRHIILYIKRLKKNLFSILQAVAKPRMSVTYTSSMEFGLSRTIKFFSQVFWKVFPSLILKLLFWSI